MKPPMMQAKSLARAVLLAATLCSADAVWSDTAGGSAACHLRTLLTASAGVDTEAIAALIADGVDVNAKDERGRTALYCAAYQGAREVMETLLDAGADIDAATSHGRTALHVAACRNDRESAAFLLARGAEVEPPRHGDTPTPLLEAVLSGASETALLLIERGADLAVKDAAGATLPSLAGRKGLHDVVLRLVERGQALDADYPAPGALLRAAVASGALRTASLLLARGVDVNWKHKYFGESLLHLAASRSGHRVVPLLVEGGIEVDVRDFGGKTPLHRAASGGALESVRMLIAYGADIDAKSEAGWTALHFALAGHAPREVASLLMDQGAEVGVATAVVAWTPLHLAVHLDEPGVVAALLERGAPVNARTRVGGWTPLHLVLRRKEAKETVAMLRAAGGEDRGDSPAAFLPVYSDGHLYSHGRFVSGNGGRRMIPTGALYAVPSPASAGGLFAQRGSFTAAGADEYLISETLGFAPYLDTHVWAVGLIDRTGTTRVLWVTDDSHPFEMLCRDPLTGLDHAIFLRLYDGNGNPGDVVHMYYDADVGTLVDGLVESGYADLDPVDRVLSGWPGPDGECRWRKKAVLEAYPAALDALRVGVSVALDAGGAPMVLPTRVVPASVVESSLRTLREMPADIATVANGLVVEDHDEDRRWTVESSRWEIVVVDGTWEGDYRYPDGVVLVRDRERDEWRSIYDCSDIDIRNLRGDTLFADFMENCVADDLWRRPRRHVKVDLPTLRVRVVEEWEPCEAPSVLEERCDEVGSSHGG